MRTRWRSQLRTGSRPRGERQNHNAAWRNEYSHLRDHIIETAAAGVWSDHDFTKIRDALAVFSRHGLGNKKAWSYGFDQIKVKEWAGVEIKAMAAGSDFLPIAEAKLGGQSCCSASQQDFGFILGCVASRLRNA